jgi:SAM-dependent methyltransferase
LGRGPSGQISTLVPSPNDRFASGALPIVLDYIGGRAFFHTMDRQPAFQPPAPAEVGSRAHYLGLLRGKGIEIGALHRPVHAPHLEIRYVDRLRVDDLLKQYPELRNHKIVEPDILDDAESLGNIADGSQDFVIANHVIEHMANPIGALLAWQRVLAPGGRLFLAAPDKHGTFDRDREITRFEHVVQDFEAPDRARDWDAFKDFALKVSCRTFKVRPEADAEAFARELWDMNYSIHYHVWDFPAFSDFLTCTAQRYPQWKLRTVASMPTVSDEFIFVLEK